MDSNHAIKLLALRNVTSKKPDPEYVLRKIHRWYSKTFFTPLHEVDALPLTEVLQAYYEENFEAMQQPELDAERASLLETEEELRAAQRREDAEDADAYEFAAEVAREEKSKQKKRKNTSISLPGADVPDNSKIPITAIKTLPEDISMRFVDDEAFEQEVSGFGLMDQPKKDRKKR